MPKTEKRKDNKGRLLRKGESQRKDQIYVYRYTDLNGKVRSIYDADLKRLRDKETEILKRTSYGIDFFGGHITLEELVLSYLDLKENILAESTIANYLHYFSVIKEYQGGLPKVNQIKKSMLQNWFSRLYFDFKVPFSTLDGMKILLSAAFNMACDDGILMSNPTRFRLQDLLQTDYQQRIALTPEQQSFYLSFVRDNRTYHRYYDMISILFHTGLRISELFGLTCNDIDFKTNTINIDKQLLYLRKKGVKRSLFISKTKTKKGVRRIPMTDELREVFERVVENRIQNPIDYELDGYSDFLFFSTQRLPYTSNRLQDVFRKIDKDLREKFPDYVIPKTTAHVCRHTFCTNLINGGADFQVAQYLMGHASISITMDVYYHISYEIIREQFIEVSKFSKIETVNILPFYAGSGGRSTTQFTTQKLHKNGVDLRRFM